MKYVAIDLGASSGRHIFFEMKYGKLSYEIIYRFSNLPKRNDEGRLVWNHKYLFNEIINGLKKVRELKGGADAIGIDTWAVDYVLLDSNDELVHDVYSYRDANDFNLCNSLHKIISFNRLYEKTGIQFQPFNTIYRLFDDLNHGYLDRTFAFLMLPDYLDYLLTGVKRQEFTNAVSTGMINSITKDWDKEILDELALPKNLFMNLTQPGAVISKVKKDIEEEIGFSPYVINVASHDTASAVLGSGLDLDEPYISSGTWSLLGVRRKEEKTDHRSQKLNYSNEGDVEKGTRYQKNIMGLWIIQQLRHDLNDEYSFAELCKMAQACKKDIVFDVDDPELLSPTSMKEALERRIGKVPIGEMAYSIFHSLAISYRNSLSELEDLLGHKFHKINIIGGGSQNLLLNKLTKKECGISVFQGPIEATAIGNAVAMMVATKELKDYDDARRLIKDSIDITEVNL